MAFNCRLNRNITLNDTSIPSSNGCGSTSIASGGIRSRIYVFNIDDVKNLQFENDMRFDDSLIVETIITDSQYIFIDCGSVEYSEDYKDGVYSHALNVTIGNVQSATEDALSDATNSRYLVAFKVNGEENYRLFGWKLGAKMKYSMSVSEDTSEYSVTFSDESEYPLFSVYSDNFSLKDKIFSPIFVPSYDIVQCEMNGGNRNGYAIASYVLKVNSANEALDRNNMLCRYSGKKQDAYKYRGLPNGDYNILGSYDDTAVFDGKSVKIYDPTLCPLNANGTIRVNPTSFTFCSSSMTSSATVTSSNSWKVGVNSSLASVSMGSGSGNAQVQITSNGNGGSDRIVFQNKVTYERFEVVVNGYFIKGLRSSYSFHSSTNSFILNPTVEGGARTCTVSTTIPYTQSNGAYEFNISSIECGREYTITFTHSSYANEKKVVKIRKQCSGGSDPNWTLVSTYCEE